MRLTKDNYGHNPVLYKAVENYIRVEKGDTIIDCTLGLGGHSELFLEKIAPSGTLVGFELDKENLEIANIRLNKSTNKNKIFLINKNFAHLQSEIQEREIKDIKLIFFDLGLSSPQVDDAERGFSFLKEGPLDMRFNKNEGPTAEMILNGYKEQDLEKIFREYGEERFSKKMAGIIKKNLPIETTTQLARLIEAHMPWPNKNKHSKGFKKHPATKIFQALRIEVNNELEVLKSSLKQAIEVLEPGGTLIVISYHSLEDRIVKNIFRDAAKGCNCPKEIPICVCKHEPEVKILTKKPIIPEDQEIEENPRARSAKMRVCEKL